MSRLPILAAAAALLLSSTQAQAALVQREETNMSTDVCQATLNSYEANLRKRPMGIFNVGKTNVFVTCSFGQVPFGVPRTHTVTVGLKNESSAAVPVSCTLNNGHLDMVAFDYKTSKVTVQPGTLLLLIWDYKVFTYPAVTCLLPPGAGIGVTNHTYMEEIGS